MAERLKRYRPLGVTVPTVPTVDYVAAGRAKARAYGAIASGLDRMTDFALKRFEEKALIEGAEYGVENAPTMQQIKDAQGDVEDIVPGDQTTVFGRAARKAALASVDTNFEIAARNDLMNLRMEAKITNMDTATFTERSKAIVDGYTSTLQDISPATALKFRATMATVGNSALLAHAEGLLSQQQKEREALAISAADTIVNGLADADGNKYMDSNLEDIFATGSQAKTSTQEYIGIAQKIETLRFSMQSILSEVGDKASVKSYLKAFDDKVNALYSANVAEWAAGDPIKNLDQWEEGKIDNTRMQDLYDNMSIEQRQLAQQVAETRIKSRMSLNAAADAQDERVRKEKEEDLLLGIFNARVRGEDYQGDLDQLEAISPEAFIKISEEINSTGAIDDQTTVISLTMASVDGSLTMNQVATAYSEGLLSNATMLTMLEKVKAGRNEQHKEAMNFAKVSLMPRPEAMAFSFTPEDKIAAKKVAEIERKLILAVRDNPELDKLEFVEKLVKDASVVTKEDVDAKKATAQEDIEYYKERGIIAKDATVQEAIDAIIANPNINNQVANGWKILLP